VGNGGLNLCGLRISICFGAVTGTLPACHTTMFVTLYKIVGKKKEYIISFLKM
jgi:hypothetical protein